jgi:prevent-host-death family protein
MDTISASEFKATCLDIFDRIAAGDLDQVVITKRGRPVAVLHPPAKPAAADLFGCMRGSASVMPGVDLAAPLELDPLDADSGMLHR